MKLTRKEFLKVSATAAVAAGSGVSFLSSCADVKPDVKYDKVSAVQCPFCASGCSMLLYFQNNKPAFITGDKNDPVTKGYLCQRAFSLIEILQSKNRVKKISYRAPFATQWQDIDYATAAAKISQKIKDTRDSSFIYNENGVEVNRLDSIAAVAGNNLTNEELFCFTRFCRILGIANVGTDHLIKSGAKNKILRELLGYGAEPNPVYDLENSGIIFMLGADPAEDSGIYMHYINNARAKGAEIINADVIFSKSAVLSNYFLKVNPATDLVMLNAIIHFILNNDLFDKEYIQKYTEAGNIVVKNFFYNSTSNVFSGFNYASSEYSDQSSWAYELDKRGNFASDEELSDPRTVIANLKNITSFYSPAVVKEICGIDSEQFLKICEIISSSVSKKRRISFVLGSGVLDQYQAESIMHAVVILQLLTGNIGLPGGGIYSVEKYNNYQSLSDFIPDWNMLPGNITLPVVNEMRKDISFEAYAYNSRSVSNFEESLNYFSAFGNLSSSLLRGMYGTSLDIEHVYKWQPKIKSMFNTEDFFSSLEQGRYKGALFLNAGFDSFYSGNLKKSLRNLDWTVTTSCFDNNFTNFWMDEPEKCPTEVFRFTSDILPEKNGTVTNISRKIRNIKSCAENAALDAVKILADIHASLKNSYSAGDGAFPEPVNMTEILTTEAIRQIISGSDNGSYLNSRFDLNSETSVCGNHFYAGMLHGRQNKPVDYSKRTSKKFHGNEFKLDNSNGYAWPSNTIYLFNKIAVDEKIFRFNADLNEKKYDVIDGLESVKNKFPFIMMQNGRASFFLKNSSIAPLPVFYDFLRKDNSFFKFPFRSKFQIKIKPAYNRGMRETAALVLNRTDSWLLENSLLYLQACGKNIVLSNNMKTLPMAENFNVLTELLLKDDQFIIIKNTVDFDKVVYAAASNFSFQTKQLLINILEPI